MPKALRIALAALLTVLCASCMKWDYLTDEDFDSSPAGLFVVNEGNFQFGNATLSYYDPATDRVENEVFARANGFKLGDVAQSMTMYGGRGWVVVNNSNVIFAIDPVTFREVGRITGLASPRYIHFVSPRKAYVTQLYDNRIVIVDPQTYTITGYITVPEMEPGDGSTEMIVERGRYLYVNCFSYWDRVLRIDMATDQVVDRLVVGVQPKSMVADCFGRLWVLTNGGYPGNPFGYEAPRLVCIDTDSFTIERTLYMQLGQNAADLTVNTAGDRLYWVADGVYTMSVSDTELPAEPLIPAHDTYYNALTVSPFNDDIYLADAADYQQYGLVYRYNRHGELLATIQVGVIPGAFCWNTSDTEP